MKESYLGVLCTLKCNDIIGNIGKSMVLKLYSWDYGNKIGYLGDKV